MSPVHKFDIRPPALKTLDDAHMRDEIERFLQFIYQSHNALNGVTIQAPTTNQGFSVQSGTTQVTGSKTGVVTGLSSVLRVTASLDTGATATNFTVSARPSTTVRGAVDLYVWKPTAAGDTTPIAATTVTTVHWWATGTPGAQVPVTT
jgi:hypothetical protein